MATTKIDITKQIALIDEHFKATPVRLSAKTDVRTVVCKYYTQAAPVITLLAQILGKNAGAAVTALNVAMTAFCSDTKKASPAILTKVCQAWAKVSFFIKPAMGLLKLKPNWFKAVDGLSAGIDSLCASIATEQA